jgi:hypothetical protein
MPAEGIRLALANRRAMAKPPRLTLPVWAINDAVRRDPAAVIRLTRAAERVKAAQLGGRTAELPRATESYHAALSRLEARAVASLEGTGRRVTTAIRMRIRRTLTATAADTKERNALRHGRLGREVAPAGFDVFGPTGRALRLLPRVAPDPSAPAGSAGVTGSDDPRRRRAQQQVRLRTAVTTGRSRVRALESRARALETHATREAAAVRAAQRRADAARQAADGAKAAVRQARVDLTAAEDALRASETAG